MNDNEDFVYDEGLDEYEEEPSHEEVTEVAEVLSSQMTRLSMLEGTHIKPYVGNDQSPDKGWEEYETLPAATEAPSTSSLSKTDVELPRSKPNSSKKRHTKHWEAMDILLNKFTSKANELAKDDRCQNEEAVANAKAMGVKVRDFAMTSASKSSDAIATNTTHVQRSQRLRMFPARAKAAEFLYMRYLLKHGVYDFFNICTAADDLDRLYTCGFVKADDLDHPFLRALLAHGIYRRSLRTSAQPTSTGKLLPALGPWTIPVDARRPSQRTMKQYIADCEARRTNPKHMNHDYLVASVKRSTIIKHYIDKHAERDAADIQIDDSDGALVDVEEDETFVRPEVAFAKKDESSKPVEGSAPVNSQSSPAPAAVEVTQLTGLTPSKTVDRLPTPVRGRSTSPCSGPEAKGRKRSRSPSCGTDDKVSSRRVRFSSNITFLVREAESTSSDEESAANTATSEANGHQEAQEQEPDVSSSPSNSLKHARDEEEREQGTPRITSFWPTKKLKAGALAIKPRESRASPTAISAFSHTRPLRPLPRTQPKAERTRGSFRGKREDLLTKDSTETFRTSMSSPMRLGRDALSKAASEPSMFTLGLGRAFEFRFTVPRCLSGVSHPTALLA